MLTGTHTGNLQYLLQVVINAIGINDFHDDSPALPQDAWAAEYTRMTHYVSHSSS